VLVGLFGIPSVGREEWETDDALSPATESRRPSPRRGRRFGGCFARYGQFDGSAAVARGLLLGRDIMQRTKWLLSAALASTTCAATAQADVTTYPAYPAPPAATNDHALPEPASSAAPHARVKVGMGLDIGVPDGAALAVLVRPGLDWLSLAGSVTYNGMAPGLRLGATVAPFAAIVSPTFTIEGGHAWQGTVPGLSGSPALGYTYANFHLGIDVGSRNGLRFFLRGGVSYLDMSASNWSPSSSTADIGIASPSYSGWLAPSGKLGVSTFF
jgi:hypothetical protein